MQTSYTGKKAVLGIEPRTSHTLSENHATRPNSQVAEAGIWLLIEHPGSHLDFMSMSRQRRALRKAAQGAADRLPQGSSF